MKIGELAELSGVSTKAIRFYEEIGLLLNVERESNGYRIYRDDVLAKLKFIRKGRAAGLSLAEIGRILDLRITGVSPCDHVLSLLEQSLRAIDDQIDSLTRARSEAVALVEVARQFDRDSCDENDVCSIIAGHE